MTNPGPMDVPTATDREPENLLLASGLLSASVSRTRLQLPDGRTVSFPTEFLLQASSDRVLPGAQPAAVNDELTIPIVEERLAVGKREIVTGRVLIEKDVYEYNEQLDVPLALRTFDVERVVRNQPIEKAPEIRREGDTTIYPIVEEQLVITTQLILKEELHVTQRDTERRDTRTVSLKREQLTVTRSASEPR